MDSAFRTIHLKKSLVVAVTDFRANDQILRASYLLGFLPVFSLYSFHVRSLNG